MPQEQEWLLNYEEEQETDLKRFVTSTCEGEESTRDWDEEETDLKRQSKGCVWILICSLRNQQAWELISTWKTSHKQNTKDLSHLR